MTKTKTPCFTVHVYTMQELQKNGKDSNKVSTVDKPNSTPLKREKLVDTTPRIRSHYGTGEIAGNQFATKDHEPYAESSKTAIKHPMGILVPITVDSSKYCRDPPTYGYGPANWYDQSRESQYKELTHNKRSNYSCVDLKSMVKLKRLCHLLRTNVAELKTVYKKRLDRGYTYSKSERLSLDTRLQSLDDNVLRLFGKLNGISGYRKEIKDMVDMYTQNESEYRLLRALNNNAKVRKNPEFFKSPNALRIKTTDEDENVVQSWRSIIISCLCYPCLNRQRKRKKECPGKNKTN